MKQHFKILFSFLLLLFVWTGADVCAAPAGGLPVAAVENSGDGSGDCLNSIPDEPLSELYAYPMDQTTTTGLQSMARRMRHVSSRSQRIERDNLLFVKALMGHLSRHQSKLTHCAKRTFSSLRPCSWDAPADCYVFGIRHIII